MCGCVENKATAEHADFAENLFFSWHAANLKQRQPQSTQSAQRSMSRCSKSVRRIRERDRRPAAPAAPKREGGAKQQSALMWNALLFRVSLALRGPLCGPIALCLCGLCELCSCFS